MTRDFHDEIGIEGGADPLQQRDRRHDPARFQPGQGLRATGGDGSHMAVEDAVSAQFGADIPAFAKPTFERLRRTRHTAQYFDPAAAAITRSDASWAIDKAQAALSGVKALLVASPPERFS